jgi:hypothetical protein
MFVSHKHRFVYMAPGKTGTTSMQAALHKAGTKPSMWRFMTPIPDTWEEVVSKHICHLPEEIKDYYVFATVRNPFKRQISRYLHGQKNRKPSQKEFEKFHFSTTNHRSCYHLLHQQKGYVPPKGFVNYKINKFLKLETLEKDFNSLPFIDKKIEFPHKNKNPISLNLKFTPEMVDHLTTTWQEDFEFFGYSKFYEVPLI